MHTITFLPRMNVNTFQQLNQSIHQRGQQGFKFKAGMKEIFDAPHQCCITGKYFTLW